MAWSFSLGGRAISPGRTCRPGLWLVGASLEAALAKKAAIEASGEFAATVKEC